MMGWAILLLIGAAVLAGLWRFGRLDAAALQMVGAGLALAMAGYAWQGHPDLAGQPSAPAHQDRAAPELLTEAREELLGRFDQSARWLTIADSYLRRGNTRDAVGILRSGLRQHPQDSDLWVGLGNALVLHADGLLTPAAEMAYRRAEALAPQAPGPKFFYGLALAQGGNLAAAESLWRALLATAPADVSWRPYVEGKLHLLVQIRTMSEGGAPPVQATAR